MGLFASSAGSGIFRDAIPGHLNDEDTKRQIDRKASQSARRHEDPLGTNKPPFVSPQQWMAAREQIVVKEKAPTRARDDETMGSTWAWLDSTPLGEQETWEDSPEGYPQFPPSGWWNSHNDYAADPSPDPRWLDIVDAAGATAGSSGAEAKGCGGT